MHTFNSHYHSPPHKFDVDFIKDKANIVLRHLPSGESRGWNGLTNEVFKQFSKMLKGGLTLMLHHCWDFGLCLKFGRFDLN